MTPDAPSLETQIAADYLVARWKAFLHEVAAVIAGRPRDLLSFEEVRAKLHAHDQRDLGLQVVPLAQIAGSVDRYRDFDRSFLPTQGHTEGKWKGVDRARRRSIELPPVKLYRMGDVYFVRDGHHRVSVARETGAEFIDAEVIEVQARVPLTPNLTAHELELAGEYAVFLERTRLDRLRPDQRIEFTAPGGYADLWEHIQVHRYYLGLEQGRDISLEEAVTSWYDALYLPVVEVIRRRNILADFPGRTEADLYRWIMDHRHYLRERCQQDVDVETAGADFAQQFSRRLPKRVARRVRRLAQALKLTECPAPDEP